MLKIFTLLVLICSYMLQQISTYSSQSGQCTDDESSMTGGMGGSSDASLPFTLEIPSEYSPGNTINVVVKVTTDGSFFKGLLLYAVKSDNTQVGSWTVQTGFKTLSSCSGAATLSHSSATQKTTTTFQWTAPAQNVGTVEFRGLIVANGKTVWKKFTPVSVTAAITTTTTSTSSVSSIFTTLSPVVSSSLSSYYHTTTTTLAASSSVSTSSTSSSGVSSSSSNYIYTSTLSLPVPTQNTTATSVAHLNYKSIPYQLYMIIALIFTVFNLP